MTPKGLKILKIFHLLFAIMWIGGVMALISVQLGSSPANNEMAYMSAIDQLIIDEFFLIPGGIGIVITAIIYAIFTKWGFWKHNWLKVKWVLTIILVLIGAGYMGVLIKENVAYIEGVMPTTEYLAQYWINVRNIAVAGIIQMVGFLSIVVISVFKPWKK